MTAVGILDSATDDPSSATSWLLVGMLALAIPENVVHGDLVWTGFLLADLAILLLPAVALRDPSKILPPEITALAVLPALTRALGPAWLTEYATYFGVAALALAVVVEVSLFTEVEMAPWFADALVVLTTMAAIGVWAILQFYSDRYLGTDLLGGQHAVNWEFIRATVAGVVAAVVFELYFEYRAPSDRSVSDVAEGESG